MESFKSNSVIKFLTIVFLIFVVPAVVAYVVSLLFPQRQLYHKHG